MEPLCLLHSNKFIFPSPAFPATLGTTSHRIGRSNVSTAAAAANHITSSSNNNKEILIRRTANYQPPVWKFDDIQSHNEAFVGESYRKRASQLKEEIICMLINTKSGTTLEQLELIDDLQKLGLSYHFSNHINQALETIYNKFCSGFRFDDGNSLYATALYFRVLRQHGFNVPQDIFSCFLSDDGEIKPSLHEDIKGILYLYEASYLLVEGESILELAMKSATKHLQKSTLDDGKLDEDLRMLVRHALEVPLHWTMPRLATRLFIDIYETRPDMNPVLLEFAKLDFNIVQAQHLRNLKDGSMWWQGSGIAQELPFARDRIVEAFFWTVGLMFEPQYEYFRRAMTKVNALITILDDIYDVYGTLDELELFTDAIERWDTDAIEHLPDYMKVCLSALFDNINDMVCEDHKQPEFHNMAACLKKSWVDLCKSYIKEAKWYFKGQTPPLEEYVSNGWTSVGGRLMLTHTYFLVTSPMEKETLQGLQNYHNIIRCSCTLLRLYDDLATSSDEIQRGDVSKSIQCYMKEANTSEEQAREHIKFLICENWKQMNKEYISKNWSFSESGYIKSVMNLARMAQCMYQHGDGHGHQDAVIKERIYKLLFQPIPLS